jgi:hypothetical protein
VARAGDAVTSNRIPAKRVESFENPNHLPPMSCTSMMVKLTGDLECCGHKPHEGVNVILCLVRSCEHSVNTALGSCFRPNIATNDVPV